MGQPGEQKQWRSESQHLLVYTRQLATLMAAGVPIIDALEALEKSECPVLQKVSRALSRHIASGYYLSTGMSAYPGVFSNIYVGMVEVGERTGALHRVLDRLAIWLEKDTNLIRRVKASLTYPAFTLGLAVTLTLLVFQTVLPGFVSALDTGDRALPWMTQVTFFLVTAFRSPLFFLLLLALVLEGVHLWRHLQSSPQGRLSLAQTVKRIPVVGDLIWDAALARFCASLHLLLANGADLLTSLRLAGQASGNALLLHHTRQLAEGVKDGLGLAVQMEEWPNIFRPTLCQMVRVGEESSRLGELLVRSGRLLETEVEHRIEILSSLVEPALLTVVAAVVSFTLISIMLPLYRMVEGLA